MLALGAVLWLSAAGRLRRRVISCRCVESLLFMFDAVMVASDFENLSMRLRSTVEVLSEDEGLQHRQQLIAEPQQIETDEAVAQTVVQQCFILSIHHTHHDEFSAAIQWLSSEIQWIVDCSRERERSIDRSSESFPSL